MKNELPMDDLDRAILAVLPDEGEKIGKYINRTMEVTEIRKLVDLAPTTGQYAARMRLLAVGGYVFKGRRKGSGGRAVGWQRTAKGRLAAGLPEREEAHG